MGIGIIIIIIILELIFGIDVEAFIISVKVLETMYTKTCNVYIVQAMSSS